MNNEASISSKGIWSITSKNWTNNDKGKDHTDKDSDKGNGNDKNNYDDKGNNDSGL